MFPVDAKASCFTCPMEHLQLRRWWKGIHSHPLYPRAYMEPHTIIFLDYLCSDRLGMREGAPKKNPNSWRISTTFIWEKLRTLAVVPQNTLPNQPISIYFRNVQNVGTCLIIFPSHPLSSWYFPCRISHDITTISPGWCFCPWSSENLGWSEKKRLETCVPTP